ncbi:MAG TPA: hypothetical protein VMS17_14950 [Gemmataceae bacterium]|nr:hypothetical protein [Gemmataceae bacterium]
MTPIRHLLVVVALSAVIAPLGMFAVGQLFSGPLRSAPRNRHRPSSTTRPIPAPTRPPASTESGPASACRSQAAPTDGKSAACTADEYEVQPLNDPQGVLQVEPGPELKGFIVVAATLRVIHQSRIVVGLVGGGRR